MAHDHAHDTHAHDAHGDHGHGAELAFPIIPEHSGADRFLILLAGFALVGWFAFAAIMISAPEHHEGTHEAAPANENPAGSEHQ